MMNSDIKIVCPDCLLTLIEKEDGYYCKKCDNNFFLNQGIPSFTKDDSIFEGRFLDASEPSRHRGKWFHNFIEQTDITRRRTAFLKNSLSKIPNNSVILDIGCGGGGWGLTLREFGSTFGIDISLSSLHNAKKVYDNVIHASVTKLPFSSNYFDVVVSEDVFGHIPKSEKNLAVAEMFRVLKPNGLMIHSAIETDSNNIWFSFAKKYPELFRKYHIDKYGHIGLEYSSVVIKRFKNKGFEIKKLAKINAVVPHPVLLKSWFDNEYKRKSKLIFILVAISNILIKNKYVRLQTNISMGFLEKIVNPFINIDQATGLLIFCKKK